MTLRNRFPAWFDAARFRAAFVLEPAGLPLGETLYSATPLPPHDGIGVDVQVECTDERGDLRAQFWRRVQQTRDGLSAIHASFTVFDDPPHPQGPLQRRGIARRSIRRAVALYDLLGVRRIHIAATDVGRFVWPKFGFALSEPSYDEFSELVNAEHQRLFGKPCVTTIPRSGRQLVEFEVGGYGLARTALGVRPAWAMQLDLTDPVSRRILSEELQRR